MDGHLTPPFLSAEMKRRLSFNPFLESFDANKHKLPGQDSVGYGLKRTCDHRGHGTC